MGETLTITQAREASGLRLMTVPGVPTPWSEAAKGFLYLKGLAYQPFLQSQEDDARLLGEWTGQTSKPVLAFNDEPPATGWSEIVHLVERLQPEPRLIPEEASDRTTMFGLSHELCGEMGFGWSFRLLMFDDAFSDSPTKPLPRQVAENLAPKYHWSPGATALAKARVIEILETFDRRLAGQHALGSRHLVGEAFSAVDVHWACFCALLKPLPEELCATVEIIRQSYCIHDDEVNGALSQRLLDHRDFVYEAYLELPVRW
ncbi:MAG: hypothetical protein V3T15_04430 [Pseudomonadales bacterium]